MKKIFTNGYEDGLFSGPEGAILGVVIFFVVTVGIVIVSSVVAVIRHLH